MRNSTKKNNKKVNICCTCIKEYGNCNHPTYICTSSYNWNVLKYKYRYKIFGTYRLKKYIRKQHLRLNTKN